MTYRSGWECELAKDMEKRGVAVEYEAETLHYTVPRFSRVDWRIRTASGNYILVEGKGAFPPSAREKVVHIHSCNPDTDYRLLFQKGSEAERYGPKLCRKHGIKFAIGTIPDEWFAE